MVNNRLIFILPQIAHSNFANLFGSKKHEFTENTLKFLEKEVL